MQLRFLESVNTNHTIINLGAFQSFLLLTYEQKRNRQTNRTTDKRHASR